MNSVDSYREFDNVNIFAKQSGWMIKTRVWARSLPENTRSNDTGASENVLTVIMGETKLTNVLRNTFLRF